MQYSQRDTRWKNYPYSAKPPHTETIQSSGCGITCGAMVISTLTNEMSTPPFQAQYALENGYRIDGQGTSWTYFKAIANKYDLPFEQNNNIDIAIATVKAGGMVVCSTTGGSQGLFSTGGHLFVLCGVEGNTLIFADPDLYNGKYDKSFRKNRATLKNNKVYVSKENARKEIVQFFCYNRKVMKELTEINDIVWELANRGIISDKELWLKKLLEDKDAYWLARKAINYVVTN